MYMYIGLCFIICIDICLNKSVVSFRYVNNICVFVCLFVSIIVHVSEKYHQSVKLTVFFQTVQQFLKLSTVDSTIFNLFD